MKVKTALTFVTVCRPRLPFDSAHFHLCSAASGRFMLEGKDNMIHEEEDTNHSSRFGSPATGNNFLGIVLILQKSEHSCA